MRDSVLGVSIPGVIRPAGGMGNRVSSGDRVRAGEVARRCLGVSCSVSPAMFVPFIVFSLSSVACRLANNDTAVSCFGASFRTSQNITLYLSSVVSGICISKNDGTGGTAIFARELWCEIPGLMFGSDAFDLKLGRPARSGGVADSSAL